MTYIGVFVSSRSIRSYQEKLKKNSIEWNAIKKFYEILLIDFRHINLNRLTWIKMESKIASKKKVDKNNEIEEQEDLTHLFAVQGGLLG